MLLHVVVQVSVEAGLEHPFFVCGLGWSSCCPERTLQRYGLDCRRLAVGDTCISLLRQRQPQHLSRNTAHIVHSETTHHGVDSRVGDAVPAAAATRTLDEARENGVMTSDSKHFRSVTCSIIRSIYIGCGEYWSLAGFHNYIDLGIVIVYDYLYIVF